MSIPNHNYLNRTDRKNYTVLTRDTRQTLSEANYVLIAKPGKKKQNRKGDQRHLLDGSSLKEVFHKARLTCPLSVLASTVLKCRKFYCMSVAVEKCIYMLLTY